MKSHEKFRFGKWQGHTLLDVLRFEPGYVGWLVDEGIMRFDERIESIGLRALERERSDGAQLDRMALAYGLEQH